MERMVHAQLAQQAQQAVLDQLLELNALAPQILI
jgi:hypothetical protein